MRIVLAMVAFVIASPFLGYGVWAAIVLYRMGSYSQLLESREGIVTLALVGGSVLIGFAFMAAGIAMLITKPRRE